MLLVTKISIRLLRNPPAAIAHPVNVKVSVFRGRIDGIVELYSLRSCLRERTLPLMKFAMTVSKCKARRPVVIAGGLVDPAVDVRVKVTGVIDAVRMLVQIDPSLRGSWEGEIPGF